MVGRSLLLFALLLAPVRTQQSTSSQFDDLYKQLQDQYLAGRTAEGRRTGERIVALFAETRGEDDPNMAAVLLNIASIAEAAGQYVEARRWTEARLAALRRHYKEDWWQIADSRIGLVQLDWMASATPATRKRLLDAFRKKNEAERLADEGVSPEAVRLAEEALPVYLELLGPDHPYTASMKQALAVALESVGQDRRAQELFEEVLALRTAKLGRVHPFTSRTLSALGKLHHKQGNLDEALDFLQEALKIKLDLQGPQHPDTIRCVNDLAELAHAMGREDDAEFLYLNALDALREAGRAESADASMVTQGLGFVYLAKADYARAEPLLRRAIELKRSAIGEDSHAMANGLNALAELYVIMGDDLRALPLSERSLEILRKVAGPTHPDTAVAIINLAAIRARLGDARALALLDEGAGLIEKQFGHDHPHFAGALRQLSGMYQVIGDFTSAAAIEGQALDIYRKAYGDTHHWTATSTRTLAYILQRGGEPARAEALYLEAIGTYGKLFGAGHPDTADVQASLARFYIERGDVKRAEPLLLEALATTAGNLELASSLQSERQQIIMSGRLQDLVMSAADLSARGALPADRMWQRTLAWKGMILSRQRSMRAAAGRPELQETFARFREVTSDLATVAFSTPLPDQVKRREERLAALSEEKERLEAELSRQSADFRSMKQTPDAAAIRAALPAGSTLIDFFEYPRTVIATGGKRTVEWRAMAFVIPVSGSIRAVDVGPSAPIERELSRWLPVIESGGTAGDSGRRLRSLLWEPIERALPASTPVVVSPDGFLSRVPLAALPGRAGGTYLIEERAITILPSPQLLTDLAAAPAASASGLLMIGDVNYDSGDEGTDAPAAATRGKRAVTGGAKYDRLPGTRGEIDAIGAIYRTRFGAEGLQVLSGTAAIEDAFRTRAPRQRYLHLATHGFFAPEAFRSAVRPSDAPTPAATVTAAGFHPGLLSGLVLAGANQPGEGEDGILTAEEVATLDLSGVELAILSACETGLGQAAGGEGLLGLQRAFQTAGARAVIATMWRVDDEATRVLMTRFYDNLWNKRMPKREALRDAQLWMLRDGRKPPFYWAAFVLSGDWR